MIMVAVRCVVPPSNLCGITMFGIHIIQDVNILPSPIIIGIHYHEAVVATTEQINIHQQLHFLKTDKRHIGEE